MLVLLLGVLIAETCCACYWRNESSYRLFGTKTPYDTVRGDIREVPTLKTSSNMTIHVDCEPKSVWMMIRHGTRYPENKETDQMRKVIDIKEDILQAHDEGRGELCSQDVENLRKWKWNKLLDVKPSELTSQGFDELQSLGSRLEQRFDRLLRNLDEYQIRASFEQRTQMSAKAFLRGLQRNFNISRSFRNDLTTRVGIKQIALPKPHGIQSTLEEKTMMMTEQTNSTNTITFTFQPYRYCSKRYKDILLGPRIPQEINKYINTLEFKHVLTSVQNRTGLAQQLLPQEILALYNLCRYYRTYTEQLQDPWCAIFTNHDVKVLEYVEDVRHYYGNSHGHKMNAKLGASSLKDLYEKFTRAREGVRSFTSYFTHDTLLGMIYAALGLYKDSPHITGSIRMENRKWRTSLLTPYAANFIVVLNKCNDAKGSTIKIQFFLNEVELKVCGTESGCDWKQFVKMFHKFTKNDLSFCGPVSESI